MFKEDIERTIGKVLKDNGHKSIPIAKHCIYYIKRYSDKLGFYIRCIDNRHHNGGISIQMFFMAIQIPDDRIVTCNPGLEIHILYCLTISLAVKPDCITLTGLIA